MLDLNITNTESKESPVIRGLSIAKVQINPNILEQSFDSNGEVVYSLRINLVSEETYENLENSEALQLGEYGKNRKRVSNVQTIQFTEVYNKFNFAHNFIFKVAKAVGEELSFKSMCIELQKFIDRPIDARAIYKEYIEKYLVKKTFIALTGVQAQEGKNGTIYYNSTFYFMNPKLPSVFSVNDSESAQKGLEYRIKNEINYNTQVNLSKNGQENTLSMENPKYSTKMFADKTNKEPDYPNWIQEVGFTNSYSKMIYSLEGVVPIKTPETPETVEEKTNDLPF